MDLVTFQKIIEEKTLLDPTRPVVAGVSGGPDSLCLLDLLRKSQIPIVVGHLNHNLREEADSEEAMIQKLCAEWSIPFFSKKIDIKEESKSLRTSVEETGRIARYRFLFELARDNKAQAVLVAHNSDDQVETILMHLLRGTGLAGLRGMDYRQLPNEWSETIPLVRPLLGTSKREILEYCKAKGLSPALDQSNQDKTYYRNRLRLELVPFLETYNPNFKDRLARMAEVIREEDDFLKSKTEIEAQKCVLQSGEGFFIVNSKLVKELHPAIKRRLIYQLMRELNPETPNITFEVIESVVEFVEKPTSKGKKSLAAGLEVSGYLEGNLLLADRKVTLDALWPQISSPIVLEGHSEISIQLNESWKVEFLDEVGISRDDPWRACLDADICNNLIFETFTSGDRFMPLGMAGKSIKLGDYWTNEGLPARARAHWPLLKSSGEVVWIPGFTINEKYKITSQTKKRIVLRACRI